MEFQKHFGPISVNEVHKYEIKYGVSLPDDYRQFLMKYNGGFRPNPCIVLVADSESKVLYADIDQFIGVVDVPEYCRQAVEHLASAGIDYHEFFPIADDSTKNSFFMSLRQQDYGSVYYWNSDYEFDLSFSVYKVADSFTTFIQALLTYKQIEENKS